MKTCSYCAQGVAENAGKYEDCGERLSKMGSEVPGAAEAKNAIIADEAGADKRPRHVGSGRSESSAAGSEEATEQSGGSTTGGRRGRVRLVVLAVLCLGILAHGYFRTENSTNDLWFLVGYNLPIGLLIWAMFYITLCRKQGKKLAVVSFLAIFCSLIVSGLIAYSRENSAMIQAITGIQKELTSQSGSAAYSQGLLKGARTQTDIMPATKGALGEMERFTAALMNRVASQRREYRQELEAIGWGRILDPERIKADRTLTESKAMIQNAKGIVEKYRRGTFILLDNARKDISGTDLSESQKQALRSGFDKGMAKSRSQIHAMWDFEADIVSEFESIVALLSSRKEEWVVQDGRILFSNEADLKAYDRHLASIEELTGKEEAIGEQSAEAINGSLDRLKNNIHSGAWTGTAR